MNWFGKFFTSQNWLHNTTYIHRETECVLMETYQMM